MIWVTLFLLTEHWYVHTVSMHVCACISEVFLLYAKLEEEHGLARHAMAVYDRATKAVPADQQLEVSAVM